VKIWKTAGSWMLSIGAVGCRRPLWTTSSTRSLPQLQRVRDLAYILLKSFVKVMAARSTTTRATAGLAAGFASPCSVQRKAVKQGRNEQAKTSSFGRRRRAGHPGGA